MGSLSMGKLRLRFVKANHGNPLNSMMTMLLCSTLVLQGLITPLLFYQSQNITSLTGLPDPEVVKHALGYRLWETSVLSKANETDKLSGKEIRISAERSFRDYRRLISMVFCVAIISMIGFGILTGTRLLTSNRKAFCKSILALSIGGHAPPQMMEGK